MNESVQAARPDRTSRRQPRRRTWWVAAFAILATVVLVTLAARLRDGGEGPLHPLGVAEAAEIGAVRVASRSMQQFAYESLTRSGHRWHLSAQRLQIRADGLFLDRPVLELRRGGRAVARVAADRGHRSAGRPSLLLEGNATVHVGDDLILGAEQFELAPTGHIRSDHPVRVRTPHGVDAGSSAHVDPDLGQIVLSPGTADERSIRWTGWGRDLGELGEAYGRWSAAVAASGPQVVQAAESATR